MTRTLTVNHKGETITFDTPYSDAEAMDKLMQLVEDGQIMGKFAKSLVRVKKPSESQIAWIHKLVVDTDLRPAMEGVIDTMKQAIRSRHLSDEDTDKALDILCAAKHSTFKPSQVPQVKDLARKAGVAVIGHLTNKPANTNKPTNTNKPSNKPVTTTESSPLTFDQCISLQKTLKNPLTNRKLAEDGKLYQKMLLQCVAAYGKSIIV